MEFADIALAIGDEIDRAHPETIHPENGLSLQDEVMALERRRITQTLERTGHNHTHTARELGLSRVGLLKKMDRMGLR